MLPMWFRADYLILTILSFLICEMGGNNVHPTFLLKGLKEACINTQQMVPISF